MKSFLTVLVICTSLISCHYNDSNPSPGNAFVGKWEWTSTSGGWQPNSTPSSTGYSMTLVLTRDYNYTTYKDASIVSQGKFRTQKSQSGIDFMIFDNGSELKLSQPSANLLLLGDDTADGLLYHYQRAKTF